MFSYVQLFVTPWTVALQALLVYGIFQARTLEWVAQRSHQICFLSGAEERFFSRVTDHVSRRAKMNLLGRKELPFPEDLPQPQLSS